MAMLLLPDVFEQTWGLSADPFWPKAIARVRQLASDFCFMAEVYWDREWTLLQQGFDYAYDKRLYDRLRMGQARPVREHLQAGLDYQNKLARFLENHDEPRAAATFSPVTDEAAAVITYLSPGLRFFHEGQFDGRRKRVSQHLVRAPHEPIDEVLQAFYKDLLAVLRCPAVVNGEWRLLECAQAWDGNWTWDCFVVWCWQTSGGGQRILVAVNYAGNQSQCYVRLPLTDLAGRTVHLQDLLSSVSYDRDGSSLISTGLYLDLPAWGHHVFAVSAGAISRPWAHE
jgi:glycosidase